MFPINIEIRQAGPGDAQIIADFNLRLARETEQLELVPDTVYEGVRALLSDARKGIYFVAHVGGEITGQLMITYEWSDWRNGTIWWLQSVYVKPEFRRRGVFRALFHHVQGLASSQGDVTALRLYMHAENRTARESYRILGMKQTKYEVLELDMEAEVES